MIEAPHEIGGHESYPYGAQGFPTPHFDLEFWTRLPKGYIRFFPAWQRDWALRTIGIVMLRSRSQLG